jgi:ComF family protein
VSLNEVLRDIADVIFPPQCLGCTEIIPHLSGQAFCPACKEQIRFLTGSLCPICGIAFFASPAQDHLCGNCLEKKPYFSLARAVASYETLILNLIHQFKYGHNITVGSALASFMAEFNFPDFDFTEYSLIIPVPLHIRRLRERGFNQALILANAIGEKYQISVNFSLLKRLKFTLTQTGLDRSAREKNVKGTFAAIDNSKIDSQNIILIDDVYTTGATVNQCAKTLIKAGANKVAVLTLARVL